MRAKTETFKLIIDGDPVEVTATRYELHTRENRFRVSYNGSPVHIFAKDKFNDRLSAIKEHPATLIPNNIEKAIGRELQMRMAA